MFFKWKTGAFTFFSEEGKVFEVIQKEDTALESWQEGNENVDTFDQ